MPSIRVISPVPWKDGTLYMWHGYKVSACGVAEHGRIVITSIGVGRIFPVAVPGHYMISIFRMGKVEFSLPMGNPDPEHGAFQGRQHDAVVPGDFHRCERALVFMGIVEGQFSVFIVFLVYELQLHEELAPIANPYRERILPGEKVI